MLSTAGRFTLLVSLLWLSSRPTPTHIYHCEIVELNYVYDERNQVRLTQYIYVDWIDGKRVARGWCLAKDGTHDTTHRTLYVDNTRNYQVRYVVFVTTSSNFDNEINDRCTDHRITIPGSLAMLPTE